VGDATSHVHAMSIGSASGASLWLEPTGPSRARFAKLIGSLAAELGTPVFDPHLTLLGGIDLPDAEVLDRSEGLASRLGPVEIRLTRAGVGSEYFNFLFFEVAATRELLAAHTAAVRAFDVTGDDFQPHVSLAYAVPTDHSPEELLKRVQGRPWGRFRSESLTVIRTSGAPSEWEVLARLPLVG